MAGPWIQTKALPWSGQYHDLATRLSLALAAAQSLDTNTLQPRPWALRLAWFPQQQRGPWTPMLPHHRPLQGPSDDRSTDINSSFLSFFRASDQCLALGHNPGPDISLDWGGQLAIHVSLFLTTLTSLDPPLDPDHKSFYLSLSSISVSCTLSPLWCPTT